MSTKLDDRQSLENAIKDIDDKSVSIIKAFLTGLNAGKNLQLDEKAEGQSA